MPEAKRNPARRQVVTGVDPRGAKAQRRVQLNQATRGEEEAPKPRPRRKKAGFRFNVAPATFLHVVLVALALAFDLLAIVFTYHMLHVNLVVGRVVALPAGVLTAAVLGYLSACYLSVIESTSNGRTDVDTVSGDWQDWFWTLPATLGMFLLAAGVGWLLSLVLPVGVWMLIALSSIILYPIFQLSSLERGSPVEPLSLPVIVSLVKHPLAWIVLYAISLATVSMIWMIVRLSWRDPPYGTMLVVGPVVTVGLFFYAWLLGQVAHLIGAGEET